MACIFYNMPYVFSGMRSASKNVALFCFLVRMSTVVLQIQSRQNGTRNGVPCTTYGARQYCQWLGCEEI